MTRTFPNPIPPPSPPYQVAGLCSYCQWTNWELPPQTNSSGKLDSVLKWGMAALIIYKLISVIRKWFSRPVHTWSGDPTHSGTCRIFDTKRTGVGVANLNGSNQNDSASGDPAHSGTCRILVTKETGVELANLNGSNQNDSAGGCGILDTKITTGLEETNQNDSTEGRSILDTKITAGVESTNQNDSDEDSIPEMLG